MKDRNKQPEEETVPGEKESKKKKSPVKEEK